MTDLEELPRIRTASPYRRRGRGHYVGSSRYTRRRRGPSVTRFLFQWISGGVTGAVLAYLIIFYGFDRDPLQLGEYLPAVSVEWPAK